MTVPNQECVFLWPYYLSNSMQTNINKNASRDGASEKKLLALSYCKAYHECSQGHWDPTERAGIIFPLEEPAVTEELRTASALHSFNWVGGKPFP